MRRGLTRIAVAAVLVVTGCRSADPLDQSFAGRSATYEPGALPFDVEARPDSAGVEVWIGIPPVGLPFRQQDSVFMAAFSLDLALHDEEMQVAVVQASTRDTLRFGSQAATEAYRPHLVRVRLDAPPGTYRLEATLRDGQGGGSSRQEVRIRVPAPGAFTLAAPRLEARLPGDSLRPVVALRVPARLDTLRATIVCAGIPGGAEPLVMLHVVRYETDTLAAEPPFAFAGIGSLAYRGVRFERADTLHTYRRLLSGAVRRQEVTFDLPRLAPGLFRLVVTATGVPGMHRQERLLAVIPPDFPRIRTMEEMIDALQYLLDRREHRRFAEAASPEAQRALFDRFWGREIGNRDAARTRLRQYYDRVEQANLRFSGYKPGWKTDRGMVFIVLGSPLYVEAWPDREIWYYAYDEDDERYTYVFERIREMDDQTPFAHYVLVRSGAYQRSWMRAIEAWRDPVR